MNAGADFTMQVGDTIPTYAFGTTGTINLMRFSSSNGGVVRLLDLADSGAPFETGFEALASGTSVITASVSKADGNPSNCSDTVTITVGGGNTAPSCDTFSVTPAVVDETASITLSARVSDDDAVDHVSFYVVEDTGPTTDYCTAGWAYFGKAVPPFPGGVATLTKSVNTLTPGEYLVHANVFDSDGSWCTGNAAGACGVAPATCTACNGAFEVVAAGPVTTDLTVQALQSASCSGGNPPGAGFAAKFNVTGGITKVNQPLNSANASKTFPDVPATDSYTTTLHSVAPGWNLLACNGGGTKTVNPPYASSPAITYYLSYTAPTAGWWQTRGGDVGAHAGSITSTIPSTCSGICEPYLTLLYDDANADSSGVVLASGSVGWGDGQLTEGAHNYLVDGVPQLMGGILENYVLFESLFEMQSASSDFSGNLSSPPAGATGPDELMPNGRWAYYSEADLIVSAPWTVPANRWIVIFVEDDLMVREPISVPDSSFLAFVVKGDVIFDEDLGHTDYTDADPVVEGVFIADGVMRVQHHSVNEKKFVGEGIFVAWSGMVLNRDLDANADETVPAETFLYRPSFVTLAPTHFSDANSVWREVEP